MPRTSFVQLTPEGRRWAEAQGGADFAALWAADGVLIGRNRRRWVVRLDGDPPVYLKRHAATRARRWFGACCRAVAGACPERSRGASGSFLWAGPSPAAREARAYHQCARLGVKTPVLLGWGEGPPGSLLLTQALDAHLVPLSAHPHARWPAPVRTAMIEQLADAVRRLHGAGLCWPDLIARHVYVAADPSAAGRGGRPVAPTSAPVFLDLERMDEGCSPRRRRRDLAALAATLPGLRTVDACRFLRAYLGLRAKGTEGQAGGGCAHPRGVLPLHDRATKDTEDESRDGLCVLRVSVGNDSSRRRREWFRAIAREARRLARRPRYRPGARAPDKPGP